VLVPFFGRRAWSHPGPVILALRSGAAILPLHVRRLPSGRHRVEFGAEVPLTRSGDQETDILAATERVNAEIEALVREHPESWMWQARRWRNSPDLPEEAYERDVALGSG